jgi:endonuclease YncB( thermonuclease family)
MCSSLIRRAAAYYGRVPRGLVLVGLVLILAAPASASHEQFSRIQHVIDGDTVVLANGEHDRGRYAGKLLQASAAARAAHQGLCGARQGTRFDPYRAAATGPAK